MRTLEWSFAGVGPRVVGQMAMRGKSDVADIADVGLDTIVNSHMDFQIAAFREFFLAKLALKRFEALMSANVNFQTTSPRVPLVTVWTLVRLLTRMNQLMSLQMTSRYKFLFTNVTLERPFTSLNNR